MYTVENVFKIVGRVGGPERVWRARLAESEVSWGWLSGEEIRLESLRIVEIDRKPPSPAPFARLFARRRPRDGKMPPKKREKEAEGKGLKPDHDDHQHFLQAFES